MAAKAVITGPISFNARHLTWLRDHEPETLALLRKAQAHVVKSVPSTGKSNPVQANALRTIRKSAGFTQAQMAERIGVDRQRYSWMEYVPCTLPCPDAIMQRARKITSKSKPVAIVASAPVGRPAKSAKKAAVKAA